MGRGVLRPLAARGPAKPLKTGQAGADEAAFLGSWAVESPISAARDLPVAPIRGVMQRSHKGRGTPRKRRERVLETPLHPTTTPRPRPTAPPTMTVIPAKAGIQSAPQGAADGAQAPSPLILTPHVIPAKEGTYPLPRHSREGGNPAPNGDGRASPSSSSFPLMREWTAPDTIAAAPQRAMGP